ncbi:hypothetical protein [Paenarthrobacter sp. C1]|uniref:hypothetical protein n=1 Tax=Paenarthrobacter sp. C1 TaxID=3400220 RepID=UPI003BF5B94E
MENSDARIDAIYEADPLLKLVGPGTITDVLKAADKAGLITSGTAPAYAVEGKAA